MRIYTGPTLVGNVADRLRSNGVTVITEGVEAVWVDTHLDIADLLSMLPTWKRNDITVFVEGTK